MEPIEQLKARLTVLEKELEKERKIAEQKEKEIKSNPEMTKLAEEYGKLDDELDSVTKQKDKIHKKIKRQFLIDDDTWEYPYFHHKTTYCPENTNIRSKVLSAINNYSSLYLLTNEDIEKAIKTLVSRAENECPEYQDLDTRQATLRVKRDEVQEKKWELERKLKSGFRSRVYDIEQEISKTKEQINNPKNFIEQEKRQSKRDEARNRLRDPKVLDEIYKRLRIRIPKGGN